MGNDYEYEEEEELEGGEEEYSAEQTSMDKVMNFMKENKTLVIIGGVVILLLIIMGLLSNSEETKTNVKISNEELTVTVDSSKQLFILEDEKIVESSKVEWMSKQEEIAIVEKDGTVKGVSIGKTTVVGTYNKKDYECEVTVSEGDPSIKVEKVVISEKGTILMSVGDTFEVPIEVTPAEAKVNNKVFSSSNPSVATIDETLGIITAKASGTSTITVIVNGGDKLATIQLMVMDGPVSAGIYVIPTKLTLNEKNITMIEGETKQLTYTQEPAEAITDYVTWISSNEEIASVYNGELVAKMPGDVEISVTSVGLKDSVMVHVNKGTVDVTGIRLFTDENLTMRVGDTKKIVASVEPNDATNKVITYSASNPSIVNVDSEGIVEATGSGSTTITVAASSNPTIYKTVYVTVNEQPTPTPTPTPEETVGTVSIVGTNNAVSVSEGGTEVLNTRITMTGSGNVDEIRYCYYNKASSSTCTPSNIYSYEFELPPGTVTTRTIYVIKAVAYYNNRRGTEVTRYVTIKPGSTPQPTTRGYDVTSGNLYNNQGTANSYHKTGDQRVTFDIRSSNTSYLKVCKGIGCTPLTRVNDNGTFTVTGTGMITVRVSEYNSLGSLVRGPDTWYVYIDTPVQSSNCYCTTGGQCRWGTSGSGYTVQASVSETACRDYINRGNKGCFANGGRKVWGSYMGNPTNYGYISTITTQASCEAANQSRCLVNTSSQGVGTTFVWTNAIATGGQVEAKALNTQAKCNSAKAGKLCFKNSAGKYFWGSAFSTSTSYTYDSTKATQSDCELASAVINEISYKISKTDGSLHFYCTSTPASACQGNVTWTSSEESIVKFTNSRTGVAKIMGVGNNYTITATLPNGVNKAETYSTMPGFPYFKRELEKNHLKYYMFVTNHPAIAFFQLESAMQHNGMIMCYYVRNNGTPTKAEIESKCDLSTSVRSITGATRTFFDGSSYFTMKLEDQGKAYSIVGSRFFTTNVMQAIEFGYVSDSELRDTGSNSEYIILVLAPAYKTGSSNVVSKKHPAVYKIKIGNVVGVFNENRYSDWTITDLTYSLYGDAYTS